MAGKVQRDVAEWLIFGLVLFALLIEIILHKLEHWVAHRHPQLQAVLRNLYRELMIMGIVSFGFIMYIFIKEPADDTKMTFEVAHIFIFLFAVFHTFVVGCAVHMSLSLSKRWKRMERMDLIKYLEHKDKYRKLTHRIEKYSSIFWRRLGWWLSRPSRLLKYSKVHETMAFHDIRYQFIYYRNLQPDFRFSKFLRKIKSATFIELVEIHPLNWICMLIIVVLDILRIKAGWISSFFEPIFLIAHSVFNIIVVSVLGIKIRQVYWKLTKNPATYYDTIDRAKFEQELAIAQEEARLAQISGSTATKDSSSEPSSRYIKRTERSRRQSSSNHGRAAGEAHHEPIYAHMTYVPDHGHYHGNDHEPSSGRYSLDLSKAFMREQGPAQLDSFFKPAKYNPKATLSADSVSGGQHIISRNAAVVSNVKLRSDANALLEQARRKQNTASRISVDLNANLPMEELNSRTANARITGRSPLKTADVDHETTRLKNMSTNHQKVRIEALRRLREKRRPNAGIVQNAKDLELAKNSAPHRSYHWLVLKLAPRLGRVPSAAERLFWFGSHRFFLWCVEWVIFFTNINISTTIAKIAFHHKEKKGSQYVAKTTRFLLSSAVRAKEKKPGKLHLPLDNAALLYIALLVSTVALMFVLLRTAGIMKKYIFVLNNANLLPESMTIDMIQTINLKQAMIRETMEDHAEALRSSYDSEMEEEDYSQFRRNVSSFIQNESEYPRAMSPVAEDLEGTPRRDS